MLRKILCVQKWSYDNYMILNPGKCYYMTFGSNTAKHDFFLEDGSCTFQRRACSLRKKVIQKSCEKVANKLNALTRIASYLRLLITKNDSSTGPFLLDN